MNQVLKWRLREYVNALLVASFIWVVILMLLAGLDGGL